MKFLLLTLVVLGILFPRGSIYAENISRGFTVSPAFQEIILGQEDTKTDFFVSVTNNTGVEVTLRIAVFDFGSLDESGGVAFLGASNDLGKKYALASWIRPEKDVFLLEPGEMKKILVTIENREMLSPGGHYGSLTFKTEESVQEENREDTISVNQLFSSLIFVKKIGGEIYNLELKGSEYKNSLVRFQDTLRVRFQNRGNVHVIPRGMATVSDPLGRIVAKGIINEESALILPETFRVYPVHLGTLTLSLVPGRYTMEITYRYDGKDDFVLVTNTYFFVPILFIGSFLIIILGCGGIYFWRKKKIMKSAIL